jgi:protein involved in polysaccharide export with SLBB domain
MLVPEGTTLLEAIAKAGGLSASARLGECAIVRQKPQLVRITANLENLLGKGILTNNPVLQDGDTVWVPPAQETRRSTWDRVNETLRDLWFLVLLR